MAWQDQFRRVGIVGEFRGGDVLESNVADAIQHHLEEVIRTTPLSEESAHSVGLVIEAKILAKEAT